MRAFKRRKKSSKSDAIWWGKRPAESRGYFVPQISSKGQIVLENYGIYQGENVFDFTTTKDKPIILCGGKNGGEVIFQGDLKEMLKNADSPTSNIFKKELNLS